MQRVCRKDLRLSPVKPSDAPSEGLYNGLARGQQGGVLVFDLETEGEETGLEVEVGHVQDVAGNELLQTGHPVFAFSDPLDALVDFFLFEGVAV